MIYVLLFLYFIQKRDCKVRLNEQLVKIYIFTITLYLRLVCKNEEAHILQMVVEKQIQRVIRDFGSLNRLHFVQCQFSRSLMPTSAIKVR
jgi:hypothetical protein